MPPKLYRFLELLRERLYKNDPGDPYLAFEEATFTRAGFSRTEVHEDLTFLTNKGVLMGHRVYKVDKHAFELPESKEDKENRYKWSWGWMFTYVLGGLVLGDAPMKRRYIIALASEEAFYRFYLQPNSHPIPDHRLPSPFPSDLIWQEITIQFLNGAEALIKFRNQSVHATQEFMDLMDRKTGLPDDQWRFLVQLSEHGGEISWENNRDMNRNDINSMKQRKKGLKDALMELFGINSDPFEDYKKIKAYRIKIKLIPENIDSAMDQSDPYGIREQLSEFTDN